MTPQVKRFFKGDLYTLTVINGQMVFAQDEEGYKVTNPALLDALEMCLKFGN